MTLPELSSVVQATTRPRVEDTLHEPVPRSSALAFPLSALAAGILYAGAARADSTAPPVTPEAPARAADAAPARAEGGLPLGGRVFTHLRIPTSDPVNLPLQQVSASAWLEARPRFNETTWARVTLTADALAASVGGASRLRAHVREAYVGAAKSGWELRVGQQLLPWGNADGINPIDVLGARDYTFFAADSEVSRLGAISAVGSFTPNSGDSPLTVTLVVTPVFVSSRLLLPPSALPPTATLDGVTRPPATLENVETALKVAYAGSGWDVAAIGFRGYNHLPELELASRTPTAIAFRQVHQRTIVGGLESSVSPGAWVLRAEGAYVWSRDADANDPRTSPSHLHGVLGVERPFGERIRVQLQTVAQYALNFNPPESFTGPDPVTTALQRGVAQANAILFNYTSQLRLAATARVAFATEDEVFQVEISALANAYGDDGFVRPMASLKPSDALRFSLGSELLFGRLTSPFGALRHYSGVFTEARYTF